MLQAIFSQLVPGLRRLSLASAWVLVLGGLACCLAADDGASARDLTVEQTAVFSVQAPVVPAAAGGQRLRVVAWVDHADNTYAIGEAVRLFVRVNKDTYLTVLNVGPTGNTTMLFPNAFQREARVRGGQTVEIPAAGSGAQFRVSGPVGRELIKVIASTRPSPLFAPGQMAQSGAFTLIAGGGRAVARDLQVVMDAQPAGQGGHEWDDYNKVITTMPSRQGASLPLTPATASLPVPAGGLRLATDRSQYRMGETVLVYATSPTPCYLTLVNMGPSGQARVLLPNLSQPQNLLPAGQTVVIPSPSSGLRLTPIGPVGVETITAICTTDNRPVMPAGFAYGRDGFSVLGANSALTRDLSLVAATPARQAAHATIGFLVLQ